ncbi:cyclopropane-fatty-acyl-phospholipid synthase [Mumia flava]|uniref:Cyclopropane-fatty-acyl-phospholipid synthase n=1 Tax=Mumia flava TaxID=1348852 RepID=A0A2M9BFU4_9ACTN|nr:cyclopropane-fatty-acyl-phospholipid synthase family protein [Mumia flava]PJJ56823.1 cyclopropane-fatty-acyl-phospholipid synthase [Mumia flava]
MTGVAPRLADALEPVLGGPLPVRLTAWDGSSAGPADAPHVRLLDRAALRRLIWRPGELGAAQAYVRGEIDVDGRLDDALRHAWSVVGERGLSARRPPVRHLARAATVAIREGAFGPPPPAPPSQVRVRGRLHSRTRDRDVIRQHYDLTTDFYALILDDRMTYSSAYVTHGDLGGEESAAYSLADAQRDKLDLVCRKVGLDRGGRRLLDVGCGWGALSLYAAQTYGARVTGVTISAEQHAYVTERARRLGLEDRVEIRLQDYRDVDDGPYDAVASLEMGEHAGDAGYPAYVETLRRNVAEDGRVLVQQMSRPRGKHPGGGPFIESFIAPDMTMRPLADTVALIEAGGLDVVDTEEMGLHYAWTVRAWQRRFEANRDAIRRLVGDEVVRVWELYLAGGLLTFEQGRMGVDQIVARRRGARSQPGTSS